MTAASVQEWNEWQAEATTEAPPATDAVATDESTVRQQEEPASPTSPSTFDRERCWVCYEGSGEKGRLQECCLCTNRMVHKKCLGEWKEMMAGTAEARPAPVARHALTSPPLSAGRAVRSVWHSAQGVGD